MITLLAIGYSLAVLTFIVFAARSARHESFRVGPPHSGVQIWRYYPPIEQRHATPSLAEIHWELIVIIREQREMYRRTP